MATLQKLPRIFISHSHLDNNFGVELAQDLRRVLGEESAVWYDNSGGLHGGDSWWDKIVTELAAREVFIVVLSPDAMKSKWVRREMDTALNEDKKIVPLLWRACEVRADFKTIQTISFIPPRTRESAFNELLTTLGLSTYVESQQTLVAHNDPTTALVRQMTPKIEASFATNDWADVIRKTRYLIQIAPGTVTSTIYRMRGLALAAEGNALQAQEALDSALALVSDAEQRLLLLSDYNDVLSVGGQWSEILRNTQEALRLAPNDVSWLVREAQAQLKLELFEEAKNSYERAFTINAKNADVQTFGKVLAKAYQATSAAPLPTKGTKVKDFPILGVGTLVAGRYLVAQVLSRDEQKHVYQVIDRQGYQHCWNCGSQANAKGDDFCIDCGAELLNFGYVMHEYATDASSDKATDILQRKIANAFVEEGKTYVIEHQDNIQDHFLTGVRLLTAGDSDVGNMQRDKPNGDSTFVLQPQRIHESISTSAAVFAIADGRGSVNSGQISSRIVINTIVKHIVEKFLIQTLLDDDSETSTRTTDQEYLEVLLQTTIGDANSKLYNLSKQQGTPLGSTITCAVTFGEYAYIANVGDSRTYLLREEELYQLTNDHSVVGQLVAIGAIEPDDVYTHPQRFQLTRRLGEKLTVEVEVFSQQLLPRDILLLCSDGLWEMVRKQKITDILKDAHDPQTACTQLIEAANANGGEDNVSVIVVFVR